MTAPSQLRLISIIGILIAVTCYFIIENPNFELVFILPLFFSCYTFLFRSIIIKLYKYISLQIIFLQLIVRFLILPCQLAFGDEYSVGAFSFNVDYSIGLMIYELTFIFLGFIFIAIKFPPKGEVVTNVKLYKLNYVHLTILAFGLVLTIINYNYFESINTLWNLDDYVLNKKLENLENGSTERFGLIFNLIRIYIVLLFICIIISNKYLSIIWKWFLLLLIISLNSVFIIGDSRLSVVYSFIPLISIAIFLLPKFRTLTIAVSLMILFVGILYSSIYKFIDVDGSIYNSISFFTSSALNAYFSGLGNITNGIDAFDHANIDGYIYFINDLTQNVPVLSKFTLTEFKTNSAFNQQIYGTQGSMDQIVPVSIAALFHFGYLFSFIYSLIFSVIAFVLESKGSKSGYLSTKFAYYYLSLSCSLFMMLNIGTLLANLLVNVVLLLVPLLLINRFSGSQVYRL